MAGPSGRRRGEGGTDVRNDQKRKRPRKDPDPEPSNSDESSNRDDELFSITKELLSRTCQTHEVTPLHNFSPGENTLRRYAKRTISDVAEMTSSAKISINRCSFKYFPRTGNNGLNCEALYVEMFRQEDGVEETPQNRVIVFQALLFAPCTSEGNRDGRGGKCSLPVVITRGAESILKAWKASMATQFNCMIVRECTLNPPELKIIAGNFLVCSSAEDRIDKESGKLILEFHPPDLNQKAKIVAELPLGYFEEHLDVELNSEFCVKTVARMWHKVLESLEGELPLDFYTPIAKFKYKDFTISSDGKVRGKNLTQRQYRTLFLSLQWVVEEGYRAALTPPSLQRSLQRSRHRTVMT